MKCHAISILNWQRFLQLKLNLILKIKLNLTEFYIKIRQGDEIPLISVAKKWPANAFAHDRVGGQRLKITC